MTFRNPSDFNLLKHLQSLINLIESDRNVHHLRKISDGTEVKASPSSVISFFILVTVGASDPTLVLFRVQSGGSGSGQVKHFVSIQPGEKGRRVKGERLSDSWAQPPWRKWSAVKRLGAPERAELDEPRWILKGEQIRAS